MKVKSEPAGSLPLFLVYLVTLLLMSGIHSGLVAGSVFAATAVPPVIWLTVLLAILGFFLWAAAYFCYKPIKKRRIQKAMPLIEAKYDEAYEVCEKAFRLSHE